MINGFALNHGKRLQIYCYVKLQEKMEMNMPCPALPGAYLFFRADAFEKKFS